MTDPTTAEELLNDPELKIIMEGCGSGERRHIEHAAKFLMRNKEYFTHQGSFFSAIRKIAHSIIANKVNIFISFKQSNSAAVKVHDALRKQLLAFSGGTVEVNSAPKFKTGFTWTQAIHAHVRKANWFILILPDPSVEWDWVLFETGMFRAQMTPGDRLICLHHPDTTPPPQISDFQAVKSVDLHDTRPTDDTGLVNQIVTSNHKGILTLLKELFLMQHAVPGMPPIAPDAEEHLDDAAKRIAEAVSTPDSETERTRFHPLVLIHLEIPGRLMRKQDLADDPDLVQKLENDDPEIRQGKKEEDRDRALTRALTQHNKTILDGATFKPLPDDPDRKRVGANERALEIFGRGRLPATWGDLIKNVTKDDADIMWLGELSFAMKDAVVNDRPRSIKASFKAAEGSVLKPILYAINVIDANQGTDPDAFFIVFVEDVSTYIGNVGKKIKPPEDDVQYKQYKQYIHYIQIASSIRLGVRLRWEVIEQFKQNMENVEEFAIAFERVIGESKSSSKLEVDKLAELFDDKEESHRVADLYLFFKETMFELKTLLKDDEMETTQKIAEIQGILKKFGPKNQQYLGLATKLFARMNQTEPENLSDVPGGQQPEPDNIVPLSKK